MIFKNQLILWFASLVRLIVAVTAINIDESGVRDFLKSLNEKSTEIASELVAAQWEFETNGTESAKQRLFQITSETIENAKQRFQNVVNGYPWRSFSSPDVRRQLKMYSEIGMLALSAAEYQQKIISDIDAVQLKTTVCDYYNRTKCDLLLSPDVERKLETSQNSEELLYLWTEWKKATEPELKRLLGSYVELCNQAARLNNYTNFKEYSLRNIEAEDVKQEMLTLWEEIKPLYSQLHAYVRNKLREVYGEKVVPYRKPIPAHLLGNIWSENWSGIADRMVPFPEQDKLNFTANMTAQGYTPQVIRQAAEEFVKSMNFSLPPHLWFDETNETLERKKPEETCRPKIFNFYHGKVRIKDCGRVSLEDYLEHDSLVMKAVYILQYSHQPFVYQSPPDPGVEEAVNNIITMSASTFQNLKRIGLYKKEVTEEVRLNRLFKLAMKTVTAMPFLLLQEFSRWDVYGGNQTEDVVSDFREKFQGISTFTKELNFDPGGIGSVFSRLSLAHHFLGHFLEFQMYDSLCQMSEEPREKEEAFDECNLSQNAEAGVALRNVMNLGSSKSLKETLSPILGQSGVNSKSILKYFEPLANWLRRENERTGEFVGWEESEGVQDLPPRKTRRKRSLEDYQREGKDDDSDNTSSKEPDRFQRLVRKGSKENEEESETSERMRKSAGREREQSAKSSMKSVNSFLVDRKRRRNAHEATRRSNHAKAGRSLAKNSKSGKELSKESATEEEKPNENPQKPNKLASKNVKRRSGGHDREASGKSEEKGGSSREERSDEQTRRSRRARNKQRRDGETSTSAQSHQRAESDPERGRSSRDARWHTDSKKDISRLLHSLGFAVENEDKDKIKEPKKKLKGDSNSDLKSSIASKESAYESMMDYNRMKAGDGRANAGEDRGANKLWSVKSYVADGGKIVQSNPGLDKKETVGGAHLTSSMIARVAEEKSIGKKEASQMKDQSLMQGKERPGEVSEGRLFQNADSVVHHFNIDVPSLQALLQKADLNAFSQRSIYTITPEAPDAKARAEGTQAKASPGKFNGNYVYKYTPTADVPQFKEKKEYREDADAGGRSPYIIILGQLSPEAKERLSQEKGVTLIDAETQAQLQGGSGFEEKKMSDKRSRASDQIYVVPVDIKNGQHNLLKTNHYAEHEREAGHDPNTERDQESEEEQLHMEDGTKLEDQSNFYKTGRENPSQFFISWNGDKNRKIVKRSKREHKKETGEDKMKVVRLAPMKESILEDLLGKSFDRSNLEDKNVKILIHDGLLNGGGDFSSLSGSSVARGSPAGSSTMEQSQTAAIQQPSSSFSSLASSVLSALSPKGKANQRQESELEEDGAMKESTNGQASAKEQKEQDMPYLVNPGLRYNGLVGKKKGAKLYADDEKKLVDVDLAAKRDDAAACCRKIILAPCPPRCPCPCPGPCPCPCPCPGPCPCPLPCPCPCPCPLPCPFPCPCPDDCCKKIIECPPACCKPDCPCPCPCPDPCCKKPSECSLVNCQFKITKAKKPHERLTIMIYDRINPPAELPEPYDALAVISEILQRIQCCSCKPCCQLTEEDPDYPANDNTDQLKGNSSPQQENKSKMQELTGEVPVLGGDNPEEDETDDAGQNVQNAAGSAEDDKYQPKEKATPALDQLTVFNRDKLKPVFIELRKIDDVIKKRSHQGRRR